MTNHNEHFYIPLWFLKLKCAVKDFLMPTILNVFVLRKDKSYFFIFCENTFSKHLSICHSHAQLLRRIISFSEIEFLSLKTV